MSGNGGRIETQSDGGLTVGWLSLPGRPEPPWANCNDAAVALAKQIQQWEVGGRPQLDVAAAPLIMASANLR